LRGKRLRAGPVGQRLATRPHAVLAFALLALEAALAGAGTPSPGLAAIALIVVPGLALLELAPARLRAHQLALLAAVPALGFAATSVALVSMARLGIHLDGWTSRGALALIVVVGLLLPARRTVATERAFGWEAAGLALAVIAGVVLEGRVLSGTPVPGNDWAKYVLYGDEIRRQGSLLIDNPFWMLGVPFREDPAVPATYGAFLAMAREPAGILAHGIWAFAVMGILSLFAYVRAIWGAAAGVVAAALIAVLPIQQDILGWHGLANVAALALLPLILVYATALATEGLRWREAAGLGLLLVALAATHRLSLTVGVTALAVSVTVGLLRPRRRLTAIGTLRAGVATLALCPLVASDLVIRGRTFGGTQSYKTYLLSKIDLSLVARDLTWPFVVAGAIAVVVALVRARRDRAVRILIGVLVFVSAMAYAWVVHLPLAYLRMAYYLPLALVPLVAVALRTLAPARWALALGLSLAVAVGAIAWGQAANVKRFYGFANQASLRGLDAVSTRLRPGEVVATDRCWSFLSTWLLHTRTLPALAPQDIQPKAELKIAREAQSVLAGTAAGQRRARALGVRFLLVDPTCTDARGRALTPPPVGKPVYVSDRLAVLELNERGR
jgi:hypothetical protein